MFMNYIVNKLYYKYDGTLLTEGNLNQVGPFTKYSGNIYILKIISPHSFDVSMLLNYRKPNGQVNAESLIMIPDGTESITVNSQVEIWNVRKVVLPPEMFTTSERLRQNILTLQPQIVAYSDDDNDTVQTEHRLSFEPYDVVCNYSAQDSFIPVFTGSQYQNIMSALSGIIGYGDIIVPLSKVLNSDNEINTSSPILTTNYIYAVDNNARNTAKGVTFPLGALIKFTNIVNPYENYQILSNPVKIIDRYSHLPSGAGPYDDISTQSVYFAVREGEFYKNGRTSGLPQWQQVDIDVNITNLLTSSQLQAINSGITSAGVEQIETNRQNILTKQDQLTQEQLDAVDSGITSQKVGQITTLGESVSSLETTVQEKLDKDFSDLSQLSNTLEATDLFVVRRGSSNYKMPASYLVMNYSNYYKGTYSSLLALETAYPTADDGSYAYVSTTDPDDDTKVILILYIWDNTDSEWQQAGQQETYTASQGIELDGTTFKLNQDFYDYLEQATYQAPSITTFLLLDENDNTISQTQEGGSSVTIKKVSHKETNISNIGQTGGQVNFKLTGNGYTEYIEPSSVGTVTALPNEDQSALTINSTTTFMLSGVNTKGTTFSRNYQIKFETYAYYVKTSSAITPTSGGTKCGTTTAFANSGTSITYSSGDYIYFYVKSSTAVVEQYVLGTWAEINSISKGTVSFTKSNGAIETYYCYRIGAFESGGTDTFRVR